MTSEALFLIEGKWERGGQRQTVVEPYAGAEALSVWLATTAHVEAAVQSARAAWRSYAALPAYRRSAILTQAANALRIA